MPVSSVGMMTLLAIIQKIRTIGLPPASRTIAHLMLAPPSEARRGGNALGATPHRTYVDRLAAIHRCGWVLSGRRDVAPLHLDQQPDTVLGLPDSRKTRLLEFAVRCALRNSGPAQA